MAKRLCSAKLWLTLFAVVVPLGVHAQTTQGFISIDCGWVGNTSYNDLSTGLYYVSDDQYIDRGNNGQISLAYQTTTVSNQAKTLRYFTNSTRNCYTLPTYINKKYLVRATFMYGNYDGKLSGNPLNFDLYIGTTLWRSVTISDASKEYLYEISTIATADFIWVCLVNVGSGTPFISALEMRPLVPNFYNYTTIETSFAYVFRYSYGQSEGQRIRWPDDPYDRIWSPYESDSSRMTPLSTTADIRTFDTDDNLFCPLKVLQTAVTTTGNSQNLEFLTFVQEILPTGALPIYYYVISYAEYQNLAGTNMTRNFSFYVNNEDPYLPSSLLGYLDSDAIYRELTVPLTTTSECVFSFKSNPGSTLPPVVSAVEIYSPVNMTNNGTTDLQEVLAIVNIKNNYNLIKNWMGDPCAPESFKWDGIECHLFGSSSRITSINLSKSALSGAISAKFTKFLYLENLNLSNNNLNGKIPDYLSTMTNLRILDLSNNNFDGGLPIDLENRAKNRTIVLRVDCAISTLFCIPSPSPSPSPVVAIVAPVVVVIVTAIAIVVTIYLRKHRKASSRHGDALASVIPMRPTTKSQQYTYSQLQSITRGFSRVIGRGGFGSVYHGVLDDGEQVAVKCTGINYWDSTVSC